MERSLLDVITANAGILSSGTATPREIRTASQTLSSLHPPLESLLPLSQALLASPSTAPIFHALLRRHLDPSIYRSLPGETRAALRTLSTALLSSPTPLSTSLHAALALREWPQNWPSFLPALLPSPAAPGVLADLSDAALLHPGVSPRRAEEVLRALALSTQQTLPVVVAALPERQAWRAAEAFVGWMNVEALFESALVREVLRHLAGGDWKGALGVLAALVERRHESTEQQFRDLFKALLAVVEASDQVLAYVAACGAPPGGVMPRLRQFWGHGRGGGAGGGVVHAFVMKLFEVMSELGVAHFSRCFMYSRRGLVKLEQGDDVVAAAFVDLLSAGLSHPSTALRLAVLPFFTSLLAAVHKTAHRSPLVSYTAHAFFHAASAALLPGDALTEGYDDEADHDTAVHNFLARCTSCLTTAAKIEPSLASLAFARMRGLLGTPPGDGEIVRATQGHVWVFGNPPRGVWERCLESAATTADAVASGVAKEGREPLLKEMRVSLEGLLSMTDASLQPFRAHAVRAFVTLFRTDANALDRCVEVLGSLITQGKGRVRSSVCASLSVIFRRCDGAGVGRYAGSLCEYCLRALGEDFHTVEKIHLVEATLTSVLALQSFAERLMYVERVLLPVLEVLSKPEIAQILASPVSLYEFLDRASVEQAAPVVGAFLVLETSAHHLVRSVSKTTGPIPLPGVLSRNVAPKSVDVACMLITSLHGLYNREKFPVDAHADALHATSREVAYFLNLEPQKGVEQPAKGEKRGSLAEQRASETLLSHGVDPPDSTHSWLRETLRDLRRSAYEILRAAILSGVTQSPRHLNSLVEAVCSDFEYIEPLHLILLITRVLHPLLSHAVVTAGPAYLESLAGSPIAALVRHIEQHVDACQKGKTAFSSSATLDIARDHARRAIARSAADMLAAIYPRREPSKEDKDIREHSPLVFKAGPLGVELLSLWQTICNPGQSRLDQGASRVGFTLVVKAAETASLSEFSMFAPLLHGSLRTAVLHASLDAEDSPAQLAISALVAVLRKWPAESEQSLRAVGVQFVGAAVKEVTEGKPKKQRAAVKKLVERLAEAAGTSKDRGEVQALPQRLVTVNPRRAANKPRNELEEIVLGDTALDSLFGEGDPL